MISEPPPGMDIGNVSKERHKTWFTAKTWRRIKEHKKSKSLLTAASGRGGSEARLLKDPLLCEKGRLVERSACVDKMNFAVALRKENEDVQNSNYFTTV